VFVWKFKLLQNHHHLPGVGTPDVAVKEDGLDVRHDETVGYG
jgi:hypothetical protein